MRPTAIVLGLWSCVLLGSCALEEVTIVEVEAVVVGEIYVNLAEDPGDNEVRAFLHWTVGIDPTGLPPLRDASVTIRGPRGLSLALAEQETADCVESSPPGEASVCFLGDPAETPRIRPGDLLEVEVALSGGGGLFGATRVPSTFELLDVDRTCRIDPNSLMRVSWSPSDGAWAYINETSIRNLPDALEPEGIFLDEDPLYLLGLSISDQDTTIVFPSEFGVFNRFDLDQDVAVRLQRGLPQATTAEVAITAVDRNYVNWARGGNFNPSGQVRIPSLRGDGTGVFGATVNRSILVTSGTQGGTPCPRVFTP